MDSETIIVGIFCLFLAIVFFPFKPQFLIFLNRLAKFEFRGAKNLRYIDQDSNPELPNISQDSEPESLNISQDFKPELSIPSWLTLTKEKFAARIIIFAILSTLIYIIFNSVSGVLVRLGNIEFSAGNEKLGIVSYDLALEFNNDLKKAVNQCYAYEAQKQYELAISNCSKAIEIDSKFAVAYFNRGHAYINLKKYDQAIADFTRDIELIPITTRSYVNRGFVYIQQNKYDLAIADFTKSIEINPKEGYAYFNRGLIYDRQGKKDLAIADYTKAIEIDSNNTIIYSARGNIYTLQKDYDLAIADFSKAIEIDPNYVEAYVRRGNAFADTNRFTQAIADYQKALAIDSDSKTKSYTFCVQGVTYTKMNDFKSATISLDQGVKLDIANENGWCKTALENAQQGIPTP